MKTLALLLAALLIVPVDMLTYADKAILDAAEHGQKKVTLVFGDASTEAIEAVAQDLRARGYKLDEEATLLNPTIIRIVRGD